MKLRRSLCLLTGAAGMYFFDPISGRRRRTAVRDKVRANMAVRERRRQAEDGAGLLAAAPDRAGAGTLHRLDDPNVVKAG